MNIIDTIKKANYVATEEDVEQLAVMHTDAMLTQGVGDGSYLKILLVACQAALGKTARRKTANMVETHSQVLNDVHARFYPAVLRGVTTADCEDEPGLPREEERRRRLERLRRATFSRSAKSTLDAYIRAMGDIRSLEVETVSKSSLRKYVNETRGTPPWEQVVNANRDKIEKVCLRLAETNPGEARDILESVLSHIQDVLDSLDTGTPQDASQHIESSVVRNARVAPIREAVIYHRGAQQ